MLYLMDHTKIDPYSHIPNTDQTRAICSYKTETHISAIFLCFIIFYFSKFISCHCYVIKYEIFLIKSGYLHMYSEIRAAYWQAHTS